MTELSIEGIKALALANKQYLIGAAVGAGAVFLVMKVRGKKNGK